MLHFTHSSTSWPLLLDLFMKNCLANETNQQTTSVRINGSRIRDCQVTEAANFVG